VHHLPLYPLLIYSFLPSKQQTFKTKKILLKTRENHSYPKISLISPASIITLLRISREIMATINGTTTTSSHSSSKDGKKVGPVQHDASKKGVSFDDTVSNLDDHSGKKHQSSTRSDAKVSKKKQDDMVDYPLSDSDLAMSLDPVPTTDSSAVTPKKTGVPAKKTGTTAKNVVKKTATATGGATKKRTSESKSSRAGILFPVGRVAKGMRRKGFVGDVNRLGEAAPVYLAAVVEYLAAEILECAGVCAKAAKVKRITPRHIQIAVRKDVDLSQLWDPNTIIQDGGVMPYETIQMEAERKMKKKMKEEKKKAKKSNK
jgi:histone H2A